MTEEIEATVIISNLDEALKNAIITIKIGSYEKSYAPDGYIDNDYIATKAANKIN